MHAQLRSVRLYIAQQRSVAPCGAVPFAAVLCRAAVKIRPRKACTNSFTLRCVLFFEHRAVPGIIRVVVHYFSFSFSTCI